MSYLDRSLKKASVAFARAEERISVLVERIDEAHLSQEADILAWVIPSRKVIALMEALSGVYRRIHEMVQVESWFSSGDEFDLMNYFQSHFTIQGEAENQYFYAIEAAFKDAGISIEELANYFESDIPIGAYIDIVSKREIIKWARRMEISSEDYVDLRLSDISDLPPFVAQLSSLVKEYIAQDFYSAGREALAGMRQLGIFPYAHWDEIEGWRAFSSHRKPYRH